MNKPARPKGAPSELRDQVRHAIDPVGDQLALLDALGEADKDDWVQLLGADAEAQWTQLSSLKRDYQSLLDSMQDALEVLVPRGWSPFQMDSSITGEAVGLARAGDGDMADQLLAGQWERDGTWRTKRVCDRVRTMGSGAQQRDLEALFGQRARLLMKAKGHHESGRYEASIPILHAQMEGIVMDVAAGRKFFTKSPRKADLADARQLITVEACLPTLQAVFGEDVPVTQASGSLSRHGVAHGRELAYDTRVNSAKCWSVLDAIVEWAKPLSRLEAERRLSEQQEARAGSQDVDELGRRLDDREFRETQDVLRLLGTSAINHRRNRAGFPPNLVGGIYTTDDFTRRGLPADHGVHMTISDDGGTVWFWRRTVGAWVLAYAVTDKERGMTEWFYAGATEPSGPPGSAEGWSEPFMPPPDWP